jgi:hypothetical protein
VDLVHSYLYLSCILYTFAFVKKTFEAVFYLYFRPSRFICLSRFRLSHRRVEQLRELVPPTLRIGVHFVVRNARVDLIHPFFAALTRSTILSASKIELL